MHCLWKQLGDMLWVHVCYTKGPNPKINCCFCTNVEAWFHDTGATSAKEQKMSRSRSGRARPERLLECPLLWTPQTQVQKPSWLMVCCLRPSLVSFFHEAECSNATSYYRTSFATLLPKNGSISHYPFYWHKWLQANTRHSNSPLCV